jgi:hypothetical protein
VALLAASHWWPPRATSDPNLLELRLRDSTRNTGPGPVGLDAATAPTAMPDRGGLTGRTLVLVLGVDNRSGDPLLDGTLEVAFERALSFSPSVDAYEGGTLRSLAEEVGGAGASADETLAQKLATSGGQRVVTLRGAVVRSGAAGYEIDLTTEDAASRAKILATSVLAANASGVMPGVSVLVGRLRKALGDATATEDTSVERTALTSSLEAMHEFALAADLVGRGELEVGAAHRKRAVEIDPDFAEAHAALSVDYWNEGEHGLSTEELGLAYKWIDRLPERERLRFLGDYYGTVGQYDKAIGSYVELLNRWPGDLRAEIDLSVTYGQKGDTRRAAELGQRLAREQPRNGVVRRNVAFYAFVASDFQRAADEARTTIRDFPSVPNNVPLVLSAASGLLGKRSEALEAISKMHETNDIPLLYADFALFEGRLLDSERELEAYKTRMDPSGPDDRTLYSLYDSYIRLRLGDRSGAVAAAEKAVALAHDPRLSFLAAWTAAAAGGTARVAEQADASSTASRRATGSSVRCFAPRRYERPARSARPSMPTRRASARTTRGSGTMDSRTRTWTSAPIARPTPSLRPASRGAAKRSHSGCQACTSSRSFATSSPWHSRDSVAPTRPTRSRRSWPWSPRRRRTPSSARRGSAFRADASSGHPGDAPLR